MKVSKKFDYIDIIRLYVAGAADFELIHCPIHDSHDWTCKLWDDHFFCYTCGQYGTISSLKNRVKTTYRLNLDAFKKGKYVKPQFVHTKPGPKKRKERDDF